MLDFSIKDFFDFQSDPIVAVEFDSTCIKVLLLSKPNHHWRVEQYGQTVLPDGICNELTIKNTQVFAHIIKALFVSLNLKTSKVMVAIVDSMVISKMIQVNEGLTDSEVEELLSLEFESHVPYPLEEVDFDFQILGASSKKKNLLDVLLVASRKENLQNLFEAFELANLKIEVVDVMSYAVERALPLLLTSEEVESEVDPGLILIFDLGAVNSNFYAISEHEVVFTRSEEFGGHQLLEVLTSRGEVLTPQAQESWSQGKAPSELSRESLIDFNTLLVTQLNRSIEFFFSVSHFSEISRIYLAGDLAHLPGLVALIEQEMKIPVFLSNPFSKMTFASGINQTPLLENSAAWVGISGLAIRGERQ